MARRSQVKAAPLPRETTKTPLTKSYSPAADDTKVPMIGKMGREFSNHWKISESSAKIRTAGPGVQVLH